MHLEGKILIVTSEYYPMPAAAAARIIPWVSELKLFCSKITVLTSNNASKEKTLIERSFFSVPNNKAKLFVRLVQELLLGLDLGLRILLKKEVIFREDLETLFGKRLWDSNEKITLNPSKLSPNEETKDSAPEELKKNEKESV